MGRLGLAVAAALCCLFLATQLAAAQEMPASAAEAASSAPATDPTPGGNQTVAGGGSGAAAASLCNPASLNATKPVPCTEEQEADALQDLLIDTPSSSDPLAAVFDTSVCDPADPEGYTQAVELADTSLLEVRRSWCGGVGVQPAAAPASMWQRGSGWGACPVQK